MIQSLSLVPNNNKSAPREPSIGSLFLLGLDVKAAPTAEDEASERGSPLRQSVSEAALRQDGLGGFSVLCDRLRFCALIQRLASIQRIASTSRPCAAIHLYSFDHC